MIEIETGVEEEFRLAEQMKNNYCDESGKETNPQKAAEILHQIGLIYRQRSPDKISLIKSAGLLNAAIVRNPLNVSQIKSDLSELCQHILQTAGAKIQNADLVKIAKLQKESFISLRNEVKKLLNIIVPIESIHSGKKLNKLNSNKYEEIQRINKKIANEYKRIMSNISQFCEKVMGIPLCQYAIIGMGSLAREEITPYSDFEHIILLRDNKNYKSCLNYFKWFSVIFHVVILNFQETIVPSLNICSLNDCDSSLKNWFYDVTTPRGISFDGMMPHACKFPLGRQQHTKIKQFTTELIKPVNEMLKYLSSEADEKNGYHLANILTKTCFVFGDKQIFQQFANGVKRYQDAKSQYETIADVRKQVKEDLNKFSTRFRLSNLQLHKTINIKQLVYRSSTLFISALARIQNVSKNSCFDVINEMAENNKISQSTAHKLRCAIAIACEIRLRIYINKKSQCDNAIDIKKDGIEKFLNIVGVASTVNFFQITYCLQCEVAKQLNLSKFYFYTDPQLMNFSIGLAFKLDDFSGFSKKSQNCLHWDLSKFVFDFAIKELETKTNKNPEQFYGQNFFKGLKNIFVKTPNYFLRQTVLSPNEIKIVDENLETAQNLDEALHFDTQFLNNFQSRLKNNEHDYDVAWVNHKIGFCLYNLNKPNEALKYYQQSLEIKQNLCTVPDNDRNIAITLYEIGRCYLNLHNYIESLTSLNKALKIQQNFSRNLDNDGSIADTLYNIGRCHFTLHNYDEALANLNHAFEIQQSLSCNPDKDRNLAASLHAIGRCHMDLHNYDEALANLNHAFEIQQSLSCNPGKDRNLAASLHAIGRCHMDLHNYDEALANLNRALEIQQSLSCNPDKDRNLAASLHAIGRCHIELRNYNEALANLKRAFEIKQNSPLNPNNDRSLAKTLNEIGRCHINLQNYKEALINLNQVIEIKQNSSLNPNNDMDLAITIHNNGCCHICLQNYDKALSNFKRALEIKQNLSHNPNNDRSLAITLHNIGYCHINLQNYEEALTSLNEALEIKQNLFRDLDNGWDLVITLHEIGLCHIASQNYDDALTNLNRALEVYQKLSLNSDSNKNFANTLDNIGRCHFALHNYDEALANLNRALEIQQSLSCNPDKDRNLAALFHSIGRCHIDLQNYNEALNNLNRAVEIKQNSSLNSNNDKSLAETQYEIGRCHIYLQNIKEALINFNQVIVIKQNSSLNPDNEIDLALVSDNN